LNLYMGRIRDENVPPSRKTALICFFPKEDTDRALKKAESGNLPKASTTFRKEKESALTGEKDSFLCLHWKEGGSSKKKKKKKTQNRQKKKKKKPTTPQKACAEGKRREWGSALEFKKVFSSRTEEREGGAMKKTARTSRKEGFPLSGTAN